MSFDIYASIALDIQARVRVLEAAAGLRKGTWSQNAVRSLRAVASYFAEPGNGEPDPAWLDWRRDTGLYGRFLGGIEGVLRAQTGRNTAEEVAQNMLAGLSADGTSLTRNDLFGEIGKSQKNKILNGNFSPADGGRLAAKMGKRRALDEVGVAGTRQRELSDQGLRTVNLDHQSPGGKRRDRPTDDSTRTDVPDSPATRERSTLQLLTEALEQRSGQAIMGWILDIWRGAARDSERAVVEFLADNPKLMENLYVHGGQGKLYKAMQDAGIEVSSPMVRKTVRRLTQVAVRKVDQSQAVQDALDAINQRAASARPNRIVRAHYNRVARLWLMAVLDRLAYYPYRETTVPVGQWYASKRNRGEWVAEVHFPGGGVERAFFGEDNPHQWSWMRGVTNAEQAAERWVRNYQQSNPQMRFVGPKERGEGRRHAGRDQVVTHFIITSWKDGQETRYGWRRNYGRPNKANLMKVVKGKQGEFHEARLEAADGTVVAVVKGR